jgi:hypothetical protein
VIFGTPVAAFERTGEQIFALNDLPNRSRLSVQELRSKLNRNRNVRISDRVNAAAKPVARFEDHHTRAGVRQSSCRSQSGQTTANNENRLHGKLLLVLDEI